ncbi:biliverdin-producing heme oxygenase [Deinococcus sp. QL22]|uniref:biliverdin-producing heme oxygenase n=1 Tax=Deinococcus sp. QL22 TaxID=2939437 RepID=UPI0020171675|nr:biliverdin-producing heme oxygenase [Deinococcus sp. QL22]UQN08670.1 biliverdin-producing heme oxygenase [Deinococcus sp. QL22]
MLQLRQATLQHHQEVEAFMPVMQPHLRLETYQHLLGQLYTVVAPLEGQLLALPLPEQFEVGARQKAGLLRRDLSVLGVTSLPLGLSLPPLSLPQALGALYVLEGATLGGQMIERHLHACLGLTAARGSAYFTAYGPATGQMWRRFGAAMACSVLPEDEPAVIAGAQTTFAAFRSALAPCPV